MTIKQVYAGIPIALVWSDPTPTRWLVVSILEATYFVNAAGLFYLSALLERRQLINLAKNAASFASEKVRS